MYSTYLCMYVCMYACINGEYVLYLEEDYLHDTYRERVSSNFLQQRTYQPVHVSYTNVIPYYFDKYVLCGVRRTKINEVATRLGSSTAYLLGVGVGTVCIQYKVPSND